MGNEELKPTSAKERRQKKKLVVRVSEDLVVRIRKMDMLDLVLNNLVPLPLLKAATKYEKIQAEVGQLRLAQKEDQSQEEEIQQKIDLLQKQMDPQLLKDWREFLKRYALAVVAEPHLVDGPSSNEDDLDVNDLDAEELLGILNADKEGEPLLTREAADEFRRSEQPADDPPVQDGKAVRPEAELVDFPEREAIYA